MHNEFNEFLHKLTAGKDAYLKSKSKADFMKFLDTWKFKDENSEYYHINDYYDSFGRLWIKSGKFDEYKDKPEVQAVLEEAMRHEASKGLVAAEKPVSSFQLAIEAKKAAIDLPQEMRDKIKEIVTEGRMVDYKFKHVFDAHFYLRLPPDGQWLLAVTYAESKLTALAKSPYVTQGSSGGNYDPELPGVKAAIKGKARVKVLYGMGAKRHSNISPKTLDIMKRIGAIRESGNIRILYEGMMKFFAENEPYQKHLFRATGLTKGDWETAKSTIYEEDKEGYADVALVLHVNSKVGRARNKRAYDVILPLIKAGNMTAYDYSLAVPDTTAGDLFSYVQENKANLSADDVDKILTYFSKNYLDFVEVDVGEMANLEVKGPKGERTSGADIYKFLKDNHMTPDAGSVDYMVDYFEREGEYPSGRSSQQLAEIKARIADIMVEINKVQDEFLDKVLEPIERKIEMRRMRGRLAEGGAEPSSYGDAVSRQAYDIK